VKSRSTMWLYSVSFTIYSGEWVSGKIVPNCVESTISTVIQGAVLGIIVD